MQSPNFRALCDWRGKNGWVFADKARSRYIVIVVAQPQAQAICHNCSNWTGTRFACLCFQNLIRQTMAGRIMAINKPISLRPRTVFSVLLGLCLAVESSKIPVPLAKQHKTGEGKNWGSVPQNAIVCFCLCRPKAVNGWWGQLNYTVARDALCFFFFRLLHLQIAARLQKEKRSGLGVTRGEIVPVSPCQVLRH